MNTIIRIAVSGFAFVAIPVSAAERIIEERSWTETFAVASPAPEVLVDNIWGNVTVVAGPAGEISLTVNERRAAPTQSLFDLSLQIMSLEIDADEAGLTVRVGDTERNWRQFNGCRGCRVDYQFTLQVPKDSIIDVGTVTDGRVEVSGIEGSVAARNVNGPIEVIGMRECRAFESINGAMSVSFASAPTRDCELETINGDITLGLPNDAGLDVAINVYNGRVVSDFDVDPLALPARVEEIEEQGRYRYRIEQPAGVRLHGGGPTFSFSSLNGDVRIKSNP